MADSKNKVKFLKRGATFFKEIRSELKKVIWPSKSQLINNTLTVIAFCIVVGAIIWIADNLVFGPLFGFIAGR